MLEIAKFGLLAATATILTIILALANLVVTSRVVEGVIGKPRILSEVIDRTEELLTSGGLADYLKVALLILLEELFARALFLGLLPQQLPGTPLTWGIAGNTVWALAHLTNFAPGSRNPARVLPQFTGGFFFMWLFSRHGFFWTLVAHLACDAIVFAYVHIKLRPAENK